MRIGKYESIKEESQRVRARKIKHEITEHERERERFVKRNLEKEL